MPSVVLRQRLDFPEDDGFARQLAAQLRRHLAGDEPAAIAFARLPDGGWRLRAGAGEVAVDDLAVGAAAARHLVALGASELRYVGAATEGLRLRGFAIAAGAFGRGCRRLETLPAGGVGIFADGAAAEGEALARLAAAGLAVPRDALLLGIDDGRLPPPRAPGLSRLRLDLGRIAEAAIGLARGGGGNVLMPPSEVVTRASSDAGGEDPHLAAALAHLRAHLQRPLGVADLAHAAGMPRRSLERLFRTALGRSPLDEIRRQRVLRAQELLAHSDLLLPEIALRCGFSGPDRLGVVFRQVSGAAPGEWRRQHRPG